MRKWLLGISIALAGAVVVATDADARRLGGGRSVGVQRNITPAPSRPAQQAAPQQQTAPQQQPVQPGNRWGMLGGILGGLALGGFLGYLFGGSGLGGIVLIALLAFAVVLLVRAFTRRNQTGELAGMGHESMAVPERSLSGGAASQTAAQAPTVPSGFDTAGFLRAAKMNFIKLQVANDSGSLDEIREFTTGEMFDELRRDVQAGQQTDVVALNADLLELATERDKHWASVRFSGMVRETPGTQPVGFEEVWNLVKPADGSSGWLLAGIQQMH